MSSSIIKEDLNEHFTFSKKNTLLNIEEDNKKSTDLKNDLNLEQSVETPEMKNNIRIKAIKINTKLTNEEI